MLDRVLQHPRSAFDGLLMSVGNFPASVMVEERPNAQLATIMAARGQFSALKSCARNCFGVELPSGAKRTAMSRLEFLGIGPRTWMAVSDDGQTDLQHELTLGFGSLAAVTDQSDGYGVLRLSGPKVCATLEKGVAVDFHPRAFTLTDVAITDCAHVGLTLWKTDELPTFTVVLFRSLAGSFWHWLSLSAAEFGLSVDRQVKLP